MHFGICRSATDLRVTSSYRICSSTYSIHTMSISFWLMFTGCLRRVVLCELLFQTSRNVLRLMRRIIGAFLRVGARRGHGGRRDARVWRTFLHTPARHQTLLPESIRTSSDMTLRRSNTHCQMQVSRIL